MPLAPLRPCRPGCPTLTRGGPCARHAAERHQRLDERRGTATARGYGAHWQRVRRAVLTARSHAYRDGAGVIRGAGPLCVECLLETPRHVTPATDVDHIDGNPHNNERENLRPLCHEHHSRRTAIDQGFARRRRA